MTLFPELKFPLDTGPDHVQAVLIVFAGGVEPFDRFLGQRHQKAFVP